eukprot:CAMPEP_0206426244 /NCGR_PEP_ID=MMETSP0324_2-20121206/4258_1 /ASSEMBLY_ACC=CAM_ASM_000836 /TAXON_ID=2866 /ORGANISM="Crypthecodinium cohnii, Strain Seligo" /LENGTH=65 /DNA_ID=CAMNT_0053891153 /DNA_START=83 /DNA_END=277 /DNA_ORIENTATION=-
MQQQVHAHSPSQAASGSKQKRKWKQKMQRYIVAKGCRLAVEHVARLHIPRGGTAGESVEEEHRRN